ncbi:MAG: excinuclease ABC subunit UvrB [Candidatus Saccharibacteria bacterium]|nr:excinuclease ABC subunit UvrB [Candidatus Saccharibacteria bacterium]
MNNKKFKLVSPFQPQGDQPQAINKLSQNLKKGHNEQVLLGATGTGKTFTVANIIAQHQKPTLVLVHNKTLAAQLYGEFKAFFPNNAVHYFVSYFDYYQPEAYKPQTDTYIEKDSDINEEIDRLRHAATTALLSRSDVLIVASVSCIYGLGDVASYKDLSVTLKAGTIRDRAKLIRHLSDIQYQRNDMELKRGTFRIKGDVLDIQPADIDVAYRVDFWGNQIERIRQFDPLTGQFEANQPTLTVFPSSHYVTTEERLKQALVDIKQELADRLAWFKSQNLDLEAQRLNQRVSYDLEMMAETGFVKGIENYSRYLTNRRIGQEPVTLLDYFSDDFLLLIDESHLTIPQVRGMYAGDRSRKQTLVDYGFRLPSALDNRPLNFEEFEQHFNQVIYISATPGDWELTRCPKPIEQIIRPTGLLDPLVEVRPIKGQIDDLIDLIQKTVAKKQRVLITVLTKRLAENLNDHLADLQIKVQWLHSDVDTLERVDILRDLRAGVYDVIVGINLLREGLDLPEVSLVIILDADKEGFLRSDRALIQTIGRAARHQEGRVIMYADQITQSMQRAIDETNRRRDIQIAFNKKHNITPRTIVKEINSSLRLTEPTESTKIKQRRHEFQKSLKTIPKDELPQLEYQLTQAMHEHAANLEFEQAAEIRDHLRSLKEKT